MIHEITCTTIAMVCFLLYPSNQFFGIKPAIDEVYSILFHSSIFFSIVMSYDRQVGHVFGDHVASLSLMYGNKNKA